MKAIFIRRHREADNIFSFWFKPERPLNFLAGQYTELTLPHAHPDERGIKRWFTISSSPTTLPDIAITTRIGSPSSSFKQSLGKLKPGAVVELAEPMGDFVLPQDHNRPLVFLAGGIGITPFNSIIQWLIATRQKRDITFLYAAKNETELIFQEQFERYGMRRQIILNQPSVGWRGLKGRISASRVLALAKPEAEALIYLSGPEPMVEAISLSLAKSWPKDQIICDYFPGYDSI